MLKKLLLAALAMTMTYSAAQAAAGVRFNVIKGDAEKPYDKMLEEKLEATGFILSDPHARINDGYATKYGGTNLSNLGFFSISADVAMRELFLTDPKIGGFVPFNLHIYKLKAEDKTYVGHVNPKTMLDIVGVTDAKTRAGFIKSFEPLDALVTSTLGGEVTMVGKDKPAATRMMEFEMAFTRPEELGDFIDGFQEKFEEIFEEKKYIIAGYKNYREAYDDLELAFDKYDAYWVYSLCHFEFSNGVFNRTDGGKFDGRPDAGVFAPCSMYMYIEKGSSTLKIGMPMLENWISVMEITNADKQKAIRGIDKEIIQIMNGLGAKSI
jgi:uncharacterized protein (DUF302 family)